jgi:CHAT domain-containing protein/predicted RNA-binding Zn-ribbon protein involved in translation (DUF1610 family)
VLDISGEAARFRVSVYNADESAAAVRRVEPMATDVRRIEELSASLYKEMDHQAQGLAATRDAGRAALETFGRALWDHALGPFAKERLRSIRAGHLVVILDEAFVSTPWELLHDGEEFLCRRFAMGRIVRLARAGSAPPPRTVGEQRSLLVLTNPTGDLPGTTREQEGIRGALRAFGSSVRMRARSSAIGRDYVMENLRGYDVVHYSGHAQFDPRKPEESGWVLSDGVFSARDVQNLSGSAQPMPALVFANACRSGRIGLADAQLSLFHLSNAFLLAGVNHFVGTVAEVADEVAAEMAVHFYRFLFQGRSVGESLLRARAETATKFESLAPGWLSFVLYGDPRKSPLAEAKPAQKQEGIAGRTAVRCAACQTEILSRVKDAVFLCEVCGLPICHRCWVGRGIRACPSHRTEPSQPEVQIASTPETLGTQPSALSTSSCGQCGRSISRMAKDVPSCREPNCGAPICDRCARWIDQSYCRQHTRSWQERLDEARRALDAGRMALLVDRATAGQREAAYFTEGVNRLRATRGVRLGSDKYAHVVASLKESAEEEELQRLLDRVSCRQEIEFLCPRNRSFETTFKKATLLGRGAVLRLRVEILSDLEQQVFPGFETAPRGPDVVRERCDLLARQAADSSAFALHVLASTTGWSGEARGLALGEGRGESRTESPWAVALCDLETDEIIISPAYSRFAEMLELLRPSPRVSVGPQIAAYVRENLLGVDYMSEAALAAQFRTSPEQVRAVFRALALTGEFTERDIEGVGRVLTKNYDSP